MSVLRRKQKEKNTSATLKQFLRDEVGTDDNMEEKNGSSFGQ